MTSEPDLRSLVVQALGVLTRSRTYLNLVYLALSLPLALIYFVVLLLSLVVGALTSIAGIGLLVLLGGLAAAFGFALVERELAISLLGLDLPPPPPLPAGSPWRRLRAHLTRAQTWKSLAYLILKLPLGLFAYVLAGLLLIPALGLIYVMLRDLIPGEGAVRVLNNLAGGLLGLALLIATLHGANFLARLWGTVALAVLGPSEQQRLLWASQQRAAMAEAKRRELIVNVSHELRTPVASIQGHLDSLLMPEAERPSDIDPQKYLAIAASETRRLGALVTELLELARADRSELAVSVQAIDVVPITNQVAITLAPLARQEREVTVVHQDGIAPQTAMADADRLTQVLTNLVRNGINHTPAGGAVRVQAMPDGNQVCIAITDTGSGIAVGDLERIFDRFYRTDAARSRDAGGFGLGLSIARELVEAMGGTLTASSELGVGSTFRVRLRRPTV